MEEIVSDLFKSANDKFVEFFGSLDRCRYSIAPASLMFLGDHTHYNDGVLLSTAVDKYVAAVARKRKDNKILIASDFSENIIDIDLYGKEIPIKRFPERFILNLFTVLKEKKIITSGFEIAISSNIPDCMGLGSAAAFQLVILKLINSLCRLKLSVTSLADFSRNAEMRIVGKVSNDSHHRTVLHSRLNSLVYTDIRNKLVKNIPFDHENLEIVILDTGAEIPNSLKICSERVDECDTGSNALKLYMWGIKNLRDVSAEFLQKKVHMLPKRVFQRISYNVGERLRVEEALKNLFNNDIALFGTTINQSHKSISSDYLISSPEIDFLVNESALYNGVIASKMVSCSPIRCFFAIVNKNNTDEYLNFIKGRYLIKYEKYLRIHRLNISSGAKLFIHLNEVLA